MSVDMIAIGLKEKDPEFEKMKAVLESCDAADIEAPELVYAYFKKHDIDMDMLEAPTYTSDKLKDMNVIKVYSEEGIWGYDVDIEEAMNQGLTTVRIVNSY